MNPLCRWGLSSALVLLGVGEALLGGEAVPAFDRFDSSKGLIADHITAFGQDAKGYLWIGTAAGASRFDGWNFDNFSLADDTASDEVAQIFEDQGGHLWFRTSTGVKEYDGRRFRGLTEADGLPDSAVTAILQDRQGHLWFGTKRGIAVFHQRKVVPVPGLEEMRDKRVNVLFEDSAGRIWAGFRQDGLSVFEQGAWRSFSSQDGLPHDIVNDIREDRHRRIWIATHRGVAVFEDGHLGAAPFQDALPTPIIYSVMEDSAGGLWFRTSGAGAVRWDGNALQTWSTANGLAGDFVTAIVEDARGIVWLGTNRGLSRWAGGRLLTESASGPVLVEHISTIFRDRDGQVWVGAAKGLFAPPSERITIIARDERAERVTRFDPARMLFKDRRGGIWFPSARGLGFSDGGETIFYAEADGLPSASVQGFVEDATGTLWVSTPKGIARFEPASGRFDALRHRLVAGQAFKRMRSCRDGIILVRDDNVVLFAKGGEVTVLGERGFEAAAYNLEEVAVDPKGDLWFMTTNGLIRYDGVRSRYFPAEEVMSSSFLSSIIEDPGEGVWVGTSRGLVRCLGEKFERFSEGQGLPAGLTILLGFDSRGTLWMKLQTAEHNVLSRVPSGLVGFDGRAFSFFSVQEGLPCNGVLGYFEHPKGTLWFRTEKGLSRWDGRAFATFTVRDGLGSNVALRSVEDDRGNLWIGTQSGVSKYRDGRFSSFTTEDGLLDGGIEDLEADGRGGLWIRTARGVQRLTENRVPPGIDLIGLSIGGTSLALEPGLSLRHAENNPVFRCQGISFVEGGAPLRYLYRLEGLSEEWFGPAAEPRIAFHNLEPGPYRLQVKALNKELLESDPPAEFAFVILPPFWATWWFRAGMLALLGGMACGIYRARLRAGIEKARILNELKAAHDMQMGLMPAADPQAPGFDISGLCKPAFEVGGDYYDYFWLDEERTRLGIAVADVTGKAMKASIIAVMTSGMIHSEVGNQKQPARILQNINRPLFLKTDPHFFTTMLFAVLDLPGRTLTFANAGHLPPLVLRDGRASHLPTAGNTLPLGIVAEISPEQTTFPLTAGDRVLLYTDGLVEAMNESKEIFGFDRLERAFQEVAEGGSGDILRRLLERIDHFKGRAEQHDDITLVVVSVP